MKNKRTVVVLPASKVVHVLTQRPQRFSLKVINYKNYFKNITKDIFMVLLSNKQLDDSLSISMR